MRNLTRSLAMSSALLIAACAGGDPVADPGDGATAGPAEVLTPAQLGPDALVRWNGRDVAPTELPAGATITISPEAPPAPVAVSSPEVPPKLDAVCASTLLRWDSIWVPHNGGICFLGTCRPTIIYLIEDVRCENACNDPDNFACTALGGGTHPAHATAMPTESPDSTCYIPCNPKNSCSGCF